MNVLSTKGWDDYELLDSGDSKRLERYGKYLISRPDPQPIWKQGKSDWKAKDAWFEDDKWNKTSSFPSKWEMSYKNVKFFAKLTPFKHTGVFPEQILNWQFIEDKMLNSKRELNILNLFGYTGIASLVCAANGARVTHLDGSKPSISWARENQALSQLEDKPIRWILDDALSFTAREGRRNNKYDAIIMDPPVYGHGPSGEIWDFSKSFPMLLENCGKILVPNPIFFIVNAYAISSSSLMLVNMFEDYLGFKKEKIEYGELALEESNRNRLLSTGIIARYSSI
jgi:23S rRNA (cytosine1962-C5)-methyltransferase